MSTIAVRERLRSLVGAALVVRLVGMVSQVLVLTTLGASVGLDAFYIALIVPNLLWSPVAAALEMMLAPRYRRIRSESTEAAAAFRSRTLLTFGAIGLAASVVGVLVAPIGVRLSAPGASAEKLAVATDVAKVVYGTIGIRLVGAAAVALLMGAGRIFVPTLARLSSPMMLIAAVLLPGTLTPIALAVASAIGDVLEGGGLLWMLRRWEGLLHSKLAFDLAIGGRGFWGLVGTQGLVAMIPAIDQAFVAGLGAGALSVFVLAVRLFDSVRSVLLVPNARMFVAELGGGRATLRGVYRRTLRVGVAASLLVLVGSPILMLTVFRRGAFTHEDAMSATSLAIILGVGLIPYAFGYVLPRRLLALGRVRAVLWLSVLLVVGNATLDAALVGPLGAHGVALATTVTMALAVVAQAWVARSTSSRPVAVR